MTETSFVVKEQWRGSQFTYYASNLPGGRTTYLRLARRFSSRLRAEEAATGVRRYCPAHLIDVSVEEVRGG